jgi:hypothetical protein
VGFKESDGLFEVFSAIKRLPPVIDESSALIAIRIVTQGPPNSGIYLYFRIILVHWSFPGVSFLHIGFMVRRMGLQNMSVETSIFRVGLLWKFVQFRGWDSAIGFCGFSRTLPMW